MRKQTVRVKVSYIAMLGVCALASSGGVNAAGFAAPVTSTADITISQPTVALTTTVTPVTSALSMGDKTNNVTVANFTITGASSARLGYRWTPSVGTVGSNGESERVVSESSDNTKKLTVRFALNPSTVPIAIGSDSYFVLPTAATSVTDAIVTSGSKQFVATGTYNLSIDAAVYTP